MKKRIKKTFNVKDAQNGATVETKSGNSVRIICYDRIGTNYPIIALVDCVDVESCLSYDIDGKLCGCEDNNEDLIIIEEIETKFDKGDYVVSDIGNIYEITKIDDRYHTTQVSSGYRQRWTIEDVESNFHKWTLKDAKLGDILVDIKTRHPFIFKDCSDKDHPNHPTIFCGLDNFNNFVTSNGKHWWTNHDVRPATDTEKELLFNKLEEAGYKWNSDTLTLSKIEKWRGNQNVNVNGYFIDNDSEIINHSGWNIDINYNVFSTKKQAKAALAMARISQIMANDERFGGAITDEEWNTDNWYIIIRRGTKLEITTRYCYEYLAFHTKEQAELFLEENEDLIKMYYMID